MSAERACGICKGPVDAEGCPDCDPPDPACLECGDIANAECYACAEPVCQDHYEYRHSSVYCNGCALAYDIEEQEHRDMYRKTDHDDW